MDESHDRRRLKTDNDGGASVRPMRGLCPSVREITEHDKQNFRLYTWLLIAAEDGATLEELAAGTLGFDLSRNRDWALHVTRSYLARAAWVHDQIFPCID